MRSRPLQMHTRTVIVKGDQVQFNTPLSDDEALINLTFMVLSEQTQSPFAQSLAREKSLSPLQLSWCHKLVVQRKKPPYMLSNVGMGYRVYEMFQQYGHNTMRGDWHYLVIGDAGAVIAWCNRIYNQYPTAGYMTMFKELGLLADGQVLYSGWRMNSCE